MFQKKQKIKNIFCETHLIAIFALCIACLRGDIAKRHRLCHSFLTHGGITAGPSSGSRVTARAGGWPKNPVLDQW